MKSAALSLLQNQITHLTLSNTFCGVHWTSYVRVASVTSKLFEGEWDSLVVDEAHHLEWSQDKPSREYQVVEGLAENTSGVLLPTATPEQLGRESHFCASASAWSWSLLRLRSIRWRRRPIRPCCWCCNGIVLWREALKNSARRTKLQNFYLSKMLSLYFALSKATAAKKSKR